MKTNQMKIVFGITSLAFMQQCNLSSLPCHYILNTIVNAILCCDALCYPDAPPIHKPRSMLKKGIIKKRMYQVILMA